MVMVHADGGACHGTPLVAGRCPGCGIASDMQSLELRPADPLDAGVISSDAPIVLSSDDADRVAALLEERPGPTEAMRALFAEPAAGWVERGPGSWFLEAGDYLLQVSIDYNGAPRWTVWLVTSEAWISRRADNAATVEAAQLAAEDALRAVLVDAAAVLGLRVVPS